MISLIWGTLKELDSQKQKVEQWLPGTKDGRTEEMLVKVTNLQLEDE